MLICVTYYEHQTLSNLIFLLSNMKEKFDNVDITELIELFFTENEDISVLRFAIPHLRDGNADLDHIAKLLPRIIKHSQVAGQKTDAQIKDYTGTLVDMLVFLVSESTDHASIFIGDVLKTLEDVVGKCQTTMDYEVAVSLFQNMSILASVMCFIVKLHPPINMYASFKASRVLPIMFSLSVNAPRKVTRCLLESSTDLLISCAEEQCIMLNTIFFRSLCLSIMKALSCVLLVDSIEKYTLADKMGDCLVILDRQVPFQELLITHEASEIVDKLYSSLGVQQAPIVQEILLVSAYGLMSNRIFPTWVAECLDQTQDRADLMVLRKMTRALIEDGSNSRVSSYMEIEEV
ncbi:hypothetical protein CLU79DRAFT_748424 [Phycomyces nitens]|nr:hypothetical protein CLU79DRAFT_748424 [Phycomyces nitens]